MSAEMPLGMERSYYRATALIVNDEINSVRKKCLQVSRGYAIVLSSGLLQTG